MILSVFLAIDQHTGVPTTSAIAAMLMAVVLMSIGIIITFDVKSARTAWQEAIRRFFQSRGGYLQNKGYTGITWIAGPVLLCGGLILLFTGIWDLTHP